MSTCRNFNGVIPWTAINDMAIRLNLSDDDFEELVYIINSLSKVHSDWDKENKGNNNG